MVVLLNAVALCVLASWIFYGAYQRFEGLASGHDHELNGGIMLTVALVGLAINLFAASTLRRSAEHCINAEGAFWHIIADVAGSCAVVISGIILLIYDWDFIDPVLSILIGVLILAGSLRLAMRVFRILLEDTPAELDMYLLCSKMEDQEGVTVVHDIHAWTITSDYNAFSAHVVVDPDFEGEVEVLMRRLQRMIHAEFGLQHVTLQMERSGMECSEQHHIDHLAARSRQE